jgi:hypothetical protein
VLFNFQGPLPPPFFGGPHILTQPAGFVNPFFAFLKGNSGARGRVCAAFFGNLNTLTCLPGLVKPFFVFFIPFKFNVFRNIRACIDLAAQLGYN